MHQTVIIEFMFHIAKSWLKLVKPVILCYCIANNYMCIEGINFIIIAVVIIMLKNQKNFIESFQMHYFNINHLIIKATHY